ncbi:MAG: L-aspartate oxidase [Synergistaceae bacterium]|nr:L-aspartate oxidase [Synergistaceae bacterium]
MKKFNVIIVGTGVSGLFTALNLDSDKRILILSKAAADETDSFLAQGGICVQVDDEDFESFMEDTLKAGHYENDREAVAVMIRQSGEIIEDLIRLGVEFDREGNGFSYTREAAHSKARILHCKDRTGSEINGKLLKKVLELKNVTIMEKSTVTDILTDGSRCFGTIVRDPGGKYENFFAEATVLATGGIGGLFERSTNFPHLTGDSLAIAIKHSIKTRDISYIQVHPTSLWTEEPGRAFLISESVRGEGAVLIDKNGNRFTDELQPRDVLTKKIHEQMEKDKMPFVRLCLAGHVKADAAKRFPTIYEHCLKHGYDITKEPIPVVPAQHYFMGGIATDLNGRTSLECLYAAGETACNGVHGRNRLASNSLLESLVFSKRAAQDINRIRHHAVIPDFPEPSVIPEEERILEDKDLIMNEIRKGEKNEG